MSPCFAIVVSEFNSVITEKLLEGSLAILQSASIPSENIITVRVPGAIEIPLTAQLLAKTQQYAAIICLGAIIRGDTDHYDYVCQQVSFGCQKVMLETATPIIFGILTTHSEDQALERVGGQFGHKGEEAAKVALSMAELVKKIENSCLI